jgi:hypothetical protein
LISFSSGLNSGSPVTSSALLSFASAAAKASAGGPSYREAKGGAFDFFHHKNPVRTITDF